MISIETIESRASELIERALSDNARSISSDARASIVSIEIISAPFFDIEAFRAE